MLLPSKSYVKNKKKTKRGHKQTGVNIEFYQHRVLESEDLNLSLLVRDFLDEYLAVKYPEALAKSKLLENEEPENEAS